MQTEISHNEIADIKHKLRMHNTQRNIVKNIKNKESLGSVKNYQLRNKNLILLHRTNFWLQNSKI